MGLGDQDDYFWKTKKDRKEPEMADIDDQYYHHFNEQHQSDER